MAQREEQEAELRAPEAAALCANNCGFHGSPATNNMCQSCFQASAGPEGRPPPPSCSGHEKLPRSVRIRVIPERKRGAAAAAAEEEVGCGEAAAAAAAGRLVSRCFGCQRKLGLTAFRCRCGEMFCPEHRYTDRHVCSYDYKAAGREAIARENPVVRAAKIVRV